MTPALLSSWSATGLSLADHVWQSTIFAAAAALLVLALKKNQARVRYWIWLSASLKFLVPLSLLVAMGSHLGWSGGSATAPAAVAKAVEVASQPFSLTVWANSPGTERKGIEGALTIRSVPDRATSQSARPSFVVATALLVIWLAGCGTVLLARWLNWRSIARDLRTARRMESGREYDALARARQTAEIRTPVTLLSSTAVLEPAVLGFFRPTVLWPPAVSAVLEDAQLDAIFVHELSHVRRRDNLAAITHMAVEAAFWFHPLVWWLTTRLVEERERACDEAVLARGGEPRIYAEGLLKVCKCCLESPLPCVAGVTGSNLTSRIERIMAGAQANTLKLGKRLLLSAAAGLAVVGPIVVGVMNPVRIQAESSAATSLFATRGLPPSLRLLALPMAMPSASIPAIQPRSSSSAPSAPVLLIPPVQAQDQTWQDTLNHQLKNEYPTLAETIDSRAMLTLQQEVVGLCSTTPMKLFETRVRDGVARHLLSGTEKGYKLFPAGTRVWVSDGAIINDSLIGFFAFIPDMEGGESARGVRFCVANIDFEFDNDFLRTADLAAIKNAMKPVLADGPAPVMQTTATVQSPAPTQVYQIGNGVSSPVPIKQVDPQYPEEAKQAKIEGVVWLDGVVQINGTLQDIKVVKSLDTVYGLDQAAIDAAKRWTFTPGKIDGKPVLVQVRLELEFRLHKTPVAGASRVGNAQEPAATRNHPDFSGKWAVDSPVKAFIAGPGGNGPAFVPWARPSLGLVVTIKQDGDTLSVADQTAQTLVFKLDGSVSRNLVGQRGTVTVSRVTWQGSKLVILQRLGPNIDDESIPRNKIVRGISIDADKRLLVETTDGLDPTYITVYKPVN